MTNDSFPNLRIFPASLPAAAPPVPGGEFAALSQAFMAATGYSLKLSSPPNGPEPRGDKPHLAIDRAAAERETCIAPQQAEQLAAAFDTLYGKLHEARMAINHREAELAAGVPLMLHRDDAASLGVRLAAVLQAGGEILGAARVAMYVLNESTTALKMRSQWGFADDKLLEPARPLAGAVADLEALTGSAVALEDDLLNDAWRVPEPAAASICVPISSPTSILGTLWLFFDEPRAISDIDTNCAELTAGRLAAELEREMLWRESVEMAPLVRQARELTEQLATNSRRPAPVVDTWKLAYQGPVDAWGHSASALHYDWLMLPDDALLVMFVDAGGARLHQQAQARQLLTALRSHAAHVSDLGLLLEHASRTLWQANSGELQLGCTLLRLAADGKSLRCSQAGEMSTMLITPNRSKQRKAARHPQHGWQSLGEAAAPAGQSDQTEYFEQRRQVETGQLLVLCSRRMYVPQQPHSPVAGEAALVRSLANLSTRDPQEIAAEICRWGTASGESGGTTDALGVLVLTSAR